MQLCKLQTRNIQVEHFCIDSLVLKLANNTCHPHFGSTKLGRTNTMEASLSMQVAKLKHIDAIFFIFQSTSRSYDLSLLIRPLGGGSNSKLELLILLLLAAYGKESVTANVLR